jgi:hypothetical protein
MHYKVRSFEISMNLLIIGLTAAYDHLQAESVLVLRNDLVHLELFEIAAEVSHRCCVDAFDVWSARCISALNSACWSHARESAQKCFSKKLEVRVVRAVYCLSFLWFFCSFCTSFLTLIAYLLCYF